MKKAVRNDMKYGIWTLELLTERYIPVVVGDVVVGDVVVGEAAHITHTTYTYNINMHPTR